LKNLYPNDVKALELYYRIAGIDEAGRGPLAGPVVVAAVELDYSVFLEGIYDSKVLSYSKRERLYSEIIANARSYSIVEISADEVDQINILQATLKGMATTINSLQDFDGVCLIDGNKVPKGIQQRCVPIVKGDSTHACIAAASILAKVHRDRIMNELHLLYPIYGFDQNKGYGTNKHMQALAINGPCPEHRKTYKPVTQRIIWETPSSE
jgi:ribonuclease HII